MKKGIFLIPVLRLYGVLLAVLLLFSNPLTAQEADTATTQEAETVQPEAPAAAGADDKAGKALFNANCAACHKLDKPMTGPALRYVADKYDIDWLYKWIKNSPGMIKSGDPLAVKLYEENNRQNMNAFPLLTNTDIDNILAYTSLDRVEPPLPPQGSGDDGESSAFPTKIILSVLAAILLMLIFALYTVGTTLKTLNEERGLEMPEKGLSLWKAFAKNSFLVLVSAIFLLLLSGYFAYGWMMQLGVDKGYEPIQPIHFSHKIHAGDNEIECKYCHSSARVSATSGIPSLNVCMNCHKTISEYTGEIDVAATGMGIDEYTKEIEKLYEAVGWVPADQDYTGTPKPVHWVRVHNLPDFAYFNHSQHVSVAGLECQTCHGPVEEMEILYQHAPLTMGWCIDCHRETQVNLKDNAYYAKVHEELSKKYGLENLSVANMGGLECGKCHY